MSYFTHHVFICCNQREAGEQCCNATGGSDAFAYAKDRIGALKKNGPGAIRINKAGCLGRCDNGPVMVVYRKRPGTASSTTKTSRKSSRNTCSTAASSTA
jgi:NADH:ubiquinone oxidoreductase subunit E